jgi:hypothetical protein
MQLSFNPPSPLEYFATLVQSDDNFPLLEAAVSIGPKVNQLRKSVQ